MKAKGINTKESTGRLRARFVKKLSIDLMRLELNNLFSYFQQGELYLFEFKRCKMYRIFITFPESFQKKCSRKWFVKYINRKGKQNRSFALGIVPENVPKFRFSIVVDTLCNRIPLEFSEHYLIL